VLTRSEARERESSRRKDVLPVVPLCDAVLLCKQYPSSPDALPFTPSAWLQVCAIRTHRNRQQKELEKSKERLR